MKYILLSQNAQNAFARNKHSVKCMDFEERKGRRNNQENFRFGAILFSRLESMKLRLTFFLFGRCKTFTR